MEIDTKGFIADYRRLKKDINLINRLIKNKSFRKKWCKKYNIEWVGTGELEKALSIRLDQKNFMDRYIIVFNGD